MSEPLPGVDLEHPNAARMYDHMLGGAHNFAVDREAVAAAVAANPGTIVAARANRAFLGRVVTWCVRRGLDQFLDLGSGVPTVGNVHEIAHRHDPGARVAYVEVEPVAVAHAEQILAEEENATVTRADLRDAPSVLEAPGVHAVLDLGRPIALLATAALHFVPGDVAAILAPYRAALVPGSVVVISHVSDDQDDAAIGEAMRAGCETYDSSATPITLRSRAELSAALAGLELVPPGLVDVTAWPRDDGTPPVGGYGAVGVVPG